MLWLIAGLIALSVLLQAASMTLDAVNAWYRRFSTACATDPHLALRMDADRPWRVRLFERIAR